MRAIVTVIGEDRVGIIAAISRQLADHSVNILDLSQTVMRDYFTMIMLVDLAHTDVPFSVLNDQLSACGKDMGLTIRIQREEIFKAMHEV